MTNEISKYQRVVLRAKIKSLAYHRKMIKHEFEKMGKDSRHSVWPLVRYDGQHLTRHYHLVYGFLRNMPYKVMEQKCDEAPSVQMMLDIIKQLCYSKLTVDDIRAWLLLSEESQLSQAV